MGRQIAVVQSAEDESEINAFLKKSTDILCIPRVWNGKFESAMQLGACTEMSQHIFPRELEEIINDKYAISLKSFETGTLIAGLQNGEGMTIEWTRTASNSRREYITGGRYYYSRPKCITPSTKMVERLINRIQAYLRKTCPLINDEHGTLYIGARLAAEVEAGRAVIVWPNYEKVSLRRNPAS